MEQLPADNPVLPTAPRRPLLCALGATLLLLVAGAAYVAGTWIPKDSGHPGTQSSSSQASQQEKLVYARLVAQNVSLNNGTLSWHSQPGMTGVLLSEYLSYNQSRNELEVPEAGFYYVFLQLKLQPAIVGEVSGQVCGQVSLTLHVEPAKAKPFEALIVTVDVPSALKEDSIGGFQARIMKLDRGHRLSVRLSAYLHGHDNPYQFWMLAQPKDTVLGFFFVNPQIPEDLFTM